MVRGRSFRQIPRRPDPAMQPAQPRSFRGLRKRILSDLCRYLAFDPFVRHRQTGGERLFGPPAELLLYQSVVGIATPDAKGPRNVAFLQLLAGDRHDTVGKLIDRDHLVGADVHRSLEAGAHQPDRALDAFGHIQEGTGLLAITPNVDRAPVWRHRDLTAERSWRLFATAVPRPLRAEDIVIASNPNLDPTTTSERKIEPLAEQLFPSVFAIRFRRVGGAFFAVWRVRIHLVVGRIHTRRGRVKYP